MKTRVGDITMHYIEAGVGEPLLLIMGLGADHTSWGLQTPAFAKSYRVIAFDNRGVGQTDQPDIPYSIRGMADDAIGLMDAIGIERAHVLGASMGGMIAQHIALNHPQRVLTLQLHCTLARPDEYLLWLGRNWRTLRVTIPREMFTRATMPWLFAARTFQERPDFVELVTENVLANPYPASPVSVNRQSEAVEAHDTVERLHEIRCPTLITVGSEDILVPPRHSRELHARIPGSQLHVFEGVGHGYFWEVPDQFNQVALDFLGKHARCGG